jgi:hypothetical protein
MSGKRTSKESNSHNSRESESSHKATPQHKSSRTRPKRVPAPKKSSLLAKMSKRSAAAGGNTTATGGRLKVDLSSLAPKAFNEKLKRWADDQAAVKAKDEADAAEKKAKAVAAKKEAAEKEKQKQERSMMNYRASILERLTYKPDPTKKHGASKPQSRMATKSAIEKAKESKKTEPNKGKVNKSGSSSRKKARSLTPEQEESLQAELDSVTARSPSVSHDTPSSPIPASASGDVLDHDEQSGAEQVTTSPLASNKNEHGKRSRDDDDDDDDQTTPEVSNIYKRKRTGSLESDLDTREKSADIASRSVSVDGSVVPSSTQKSVTVESVTVNAAFSPAVNGDMIVFGTKGDAGQKYQHQQDQGHDNRMAESKQQGAGKKTQKRKASDDLLPESISQAKKPKQSHEESLLRSEADLATGESMAEAKNLKLDEVMDTPEVASSDDYESLQAIGQDGAAVDEDASANKEGADSKHDEENKSSSSGAKNDSNEEQTVQKGTTKVSKTDSATTSASPPKHKPVAHQDATQTDEMTSQATDNKPAESSDGKTATPTTNQQPAAYNGKTKSATLSQDEQKSAKTKEFAAPTSTQSQATSRKALMDTTNTSRLPTSSGSKKTPASTFKKQQEAVEEQSTPATTGGNRKKKRVAEDAVEDAEKTTKTSSVDSGKKRSREDDDSAESTTKPAKKQRASPPPPPAPQQPKDDANAALRSGRASRSKTVAEKAAAAARSDPVRKPVVDDYWDSVVAETQAPKKKKAKTEAPKPTKEDEQTNEGDAEHGVEDPTSSNPDNSSNAQDAPATANAAQRQRRSHVAPSSRKARSTAPRPQNNRSRLVKD